MNVIVPISTISPQETYGFVEVNGYLFIVDQQQHRLSWASNIGCYTKTAAVPHGVDKLFFLGDSILKTRAAPRRLWDVYEAIDANYKVAPELTSVPLTPI